MTGTWRRRAPVDNRSYDSCRDPRFFFLRPIIFPRKANGKYTHEREIDILDGPRERRSPLIAVDDAAGRRVAGNNT